LTDDDLDGWSDIVMFEFATAMSTVG